MLATTKVVFTPDQREQAIKQAQEQYRIWRLGEATTVAPPFAEAVKTSFCLPPELEGQPQSVRGTIISIHIVSQTDSLAFTPLMFTQWEGTTDWWVSQPNAPLQCYRVVAQ